MELHAFERMAQSLDAALTRRDSDEAPSDELLPQPQTAFPASTPLGMAYVPFQQWGEPFDAETALSRGTLFPELDLPFMGGGCSE